MRLLLVALLVASAFAAKDSLRWNSEVRHETLDKTNAFKPGFEYRFHLDSQISNGLPIPGSEQSAMRTQSFVSLSFPDSETVAHLRIEKIRVASLQKEMDAPKKIHPFKLFDEVELSEEYMDMLRLPVRFHYENGIVSDIEFDREDAEWSKNLKRTYLNMLQVNLSKKNTQESRLYSDDDKQTAFTAPEMTLEGECELTYTIVPESGRREESEIRVTKSINFEKCSRRVGHRYNLRFGDKFPMCEKKFDWEEREIESSTVFNYRILGTPSRFLIREVDLRSVYSYTPLDKENTLFTTFVSGNMKLVEITKENRRIEAPKSEKKETLLYSMEWEKTMEEFVSTGDESLLRKSPYPEIKNKHEVVVRIIDSLLKKMEDENKGIELSATHEMGKLVTLLRLSTKDEIKKMHREICESTDRSKSLMKDIFTDALAIAGSFNTVEHVIERIEKRDVSPVRASTLLKQLTNIRVPSEQMIDSLVTLCKDLKRDPMERQSCWLTVGSLVHGICGEHSDKWYVESGKDTKCPRDLKEKFVRILNKQFEQAETRYEKILALKTLANSGMDLIVFPLEKIIKDERQEKTIRLQAIDALRKLRSTLPRKMVSILLPLYKNTREHPEIRVAAFHQIMYTHPEKVVIDQIVTVLDKEPSPQVYAFVYKALKQLSESEMHHGMAEDIKTCLKMVRKQYPMSHKYSKMLTSSYKHFDFFDHESKTGLSLNWAALFSSDSVLPKEVMTTLETTFVGQWNKYLAQIGFSQHNIDQVLYKIFEKVEEEGLEEVIVRGKRSTTYKPSEVLRGLFSKLSIVSRKQKEQDPHALVYIRFRDMDYALLPIEEEVIPEMIKTVMRNGRIEMGEIESFLSKGLHFNTVFSSFVYERSLSIVHSMGSTLVYSSKMPTIVRMEGEVKMELLPKKGRSVDGVKFDITVLPTLASTHVTQVEMRNPLVNLGFKLLHSAQMNIPLKMSTEMKWEDKIKVITSLSLPKESRRLVQLHTRPVSYMRVWPKDTRAYVESTEKTVYVEELETRVQKVKESFFEKVTGMKINVHGHFHKHMFDGDHERIPSSLLIGENNLEITFEKTGKTPEKYEMRTTIENFNEERMDRPDMERFYEKDNEEHFEVEQFDEFPMTERERRGDFEKYFKTYKSDKAYSHRIHSVVEAVGYEKRHHAEVELKSHCDDKMRHCKVHLTALRTPVTEMERENWEMKSTMEILYPEMPESIKELMNQKHRELSINIDSRWGSEEKNEMKMKIHGEQNKEQKKLLKRLMDIDYSVTSLEGYDILVQASMLNQYKVFIKYNIESPASRGLVERFYSLLKVSAPFYKTSFEYGHNEKNIIRAQLTIEPSTQRYANLSIHTPFEKIIMKDLRLPYAPPLANIRRQPLTPIRSLSKLGSSLYDVVKPMCTIETINFNTYFIDRIHSFDGVMYDTPLTTCYSVFAKDCSSEKPEFAVLIKNVNKNGGEKKMKIVSSDSVIELEMDKRSEKMRITINGDKEFRVEKLEKSGVYMKKNEKVVVVETDDVTVEFDGYQANVKMSEYYKGKQCGICGHFDGETNNELRRADNEETEDVEEFHRSFMVKEEECEMEESYVSEKKTGKYGMYRLKSEKFSSEEWESKWEKKMKKNNNERKYDDEHEIVDATEKTHIIEYSGRICFSKKTIPQCHNGYMDGEMEEMKVKFYCFPRSNAETSRLLRESRHGILKFDEMDESFVERMKVPRTCLAY